MSRKTLLMAFSLLLLIGVVALVFISSVEIAALAGKTTLSLIIAGIIWILFQAVFPEAAKLTIAWLLRKIWRLPLSLRRLVVRNEIEGNLKRAVKVFGREGNGVLPYEPKLVWVSHGDFSQDSFFRDGKIIIKLNYSDNPHRNIVESGLLYCRAGLIPETRHYLLSVVGLARAVDLVFIQAVLELNDLREGLVYFKQDVLDHELKNNEDVKQRYDSLLTLHEHGCFTRMLLPELRDYAGRVHLADTASQHRQWITSFINFVSEAVRRHPRGAIWELDHIKERFSISVIIVGKSGKLVYKGQKPYLKAIAVSVLEGARTVFLFGSSDEIPSIAENAIRLGIVDSIDHQNYHRNLSGNIVRTWCAHLKVSEQTAVSATERISDIEAWSDS